MVKALEKKEAEHYYSWLSQTKDQVMSLWKMLPE